MYDAIIIGAGAAGLMAAGTAAAAGRKVLLVEKMEKAGRKIRITGKGRCNLTNVKPEAEFLDKVRHGGEFFAHAFRAFDNESLIQFFKQEGLRLEFERGGRVFPSSGRARDVAETLVEYAAGAGADIMYNTRVTEIVTTGGKVRGVRIVTKKGYPRFIECESALVCTGGASYPITGSTGDGYHFAYDSGHDIVEVRPALVALVSNSPFAKRLHGLRLKNVRVSLLIDGEEAGNEFGEMEFGTRGIEGPVILRLSRDAVDALIEEREVCISVDVKPALDQQVLTERVERELAVIDPDTVGQLLRKLLPKPMVGPVAEELGLDPEARATTLDQEQKNTIITGIKNLRIPVSDYGPFDEAIVTAGGVSTDDVDPLTMESRIIKGMFFAGEVLDIDADTGGYNLQVAFSTGVLAGRHL